MDLFITIYLLQRRLRKKEIKLRRIPTMLLSSDRPYRWQRRRPVSENYLCYCRYDIFHCRFSHTNGADGLCSSMGRETMVNCTTHEENYRTSPKTNCSNISDQFLWISNQDCWRGLRRPASFLSTFNAVKAVECQANTCHEACTNGNAGAYCYIINSDGRKNYG